MQITSTDLLKTPLFEVHNSLHARIAPFAGWLMPIQYTSIIKEHFHVREKTGLFDVCHMGRFSISGSSSSDDLEYLLSRDVSSLPIGKCRYCHMLNETGGIKDDLILYRLESDAFLMVVNAATRKKDIHWVKTHLSAGSTLEDLTFQMGKLDLQGPSSGRVLNSFVAYDDIAEIPRYSFIKSTFLDKEVFISKTGYTGELGFELYIDYDEVDFFWKKLLEHPEVAPIGLGARDTLRLEKAYPLYGHEIDEAHTPLEAQLERFIDFDSDFIGKDVLSQQKGKGVQRKLVGFMIDSKRAARNGFQIRFKRDIVGEVTSGSFSPSLGKSVALGYIDQRCASEFDFFLGTNDFWLEAKRVETPFLK